MGMVFPGDVVCGGYGKDAKSLLAHAGRLGFIVTIIPFISAPERIFGNALMFFVLCVAPVFITAFLGAAVLSREREGL